jgi:thiamine biosynthesis protein ThiS
MPPTETIEITLNGQKLTIPAGLNIRQMLLALSLQPDRVAVELNRQVIPRRDWDATQVPSGAVIEVVQFVGGG